MITRDQFVKEISDFDFKVQSAYEKAKKDIDQYLRLKASLEYNPNPLRTSVKVYVDGVGKIKSAVANLLVDFLESHGYTNVTYSLSDEQLSFSFNL